MTAALVMSCGVCVTTAVRDTIVDGLAIHENDNLGMVDGKILKTTLRHAPNLD